MIEEKISCQPLVYTHTHTNTHIPHIYTHTCIPNIHMHMHILHIHMHAESKEKG